MLGAPAEVRTAAEAAQACTGLYVNNRQVASLRKSERDSWDARPDARPAYVAPVLHHRGYAPIRGYVTSSEWELWRRIAGPLSLRVDYLQATINAAERLAWAREKAPASSDRLERLTWRLARSIPGGVRNGVVDTTSTRDAAKAELELVEDEDRAQREEAAARLAKLDRRSQVFGVHTTEEAA